jgi:peptide deformylase
MPAQVGTSRRVVLFGHPALRTRSRLVTDVTADVRRLFADLKASVVAAEGLGLAANQIAETVQCFAINPAGVDMDGEPYVICNPELVAHDGRVEAEEGCLSLPGLYDFLPRPEWVRIKGLTEDGRETTKEASGLLARAMLHEIDHLNGVLFIDHLGPTRRTMLGTKLKELEEQERGCA